MTVLRTFTEQSRAATGFACGTGNVRITVTMTADMFAALKKEARRHGLSLSAQIDDYVETGLAIDESLRDVLKEAAE